MALVTDKEAKGLCSFCGNAPDGDRFLVHSPLGSAAICNYCSHGVWTQVSQFEFLRSISFEGPLN